MWVETLPVSAVVVPSIVYVPTTLTKRSVNLIFVVHVPSLVVLLPLVVVIGPVGVSLADTVTVRDAVRWSGRRPEAGSRSDPRHGTGIAGANVPQRRDGSAP